jgi:NADPH2:quinone reductase
MVTFGNASGPVDAFAPAELAKRHSLYVTRPVLFDFIDSRERLLAASGDLFEVISSGAVKISINQKYSLRDATQAHIDLESRKTTGSTVLIP